MLSSIKSDRIKRTARTALAAVLLTGLCSAILPLGALAIGQTCNLACCAGRAPHAAGSCMDGSCHVSLKKASKQNHSSQRKQVGEQLCGVTRVARRVLSSKTARLSPITKESQQPRVSSTTMGRPCLPNCGSCGSGSAAFDFRNHAVIARRQRSRRPAAAGLTDVSFAVLLTLTTLVRQSAPRAPPLTLS
jgi:hypothetical protein